MSKTRNCERISRYTLEAPANISNFFQNVAPLPETAQKCKKFKLFHILWLIVSDSSLRCNESLLQRSFSKFAELGTQHNVGIKRITAKTPLLLVSMFYNKEKNDTGFSVKWISLTSDNQISEFTRKSRVFIFIIVSEHWDKLWKNFPVTHEHSTVSN